MPEFSTTPAGAPTWVDADARTRDAAKWLIGALGAIAVAIFGAGPIVSGVKLSWTDQWPQLLVAGTFGFLGLAAIVLLVVAIGKMLVPVVTSAASLSPDTVKFAESAKPGDLLPKGMSSVDDLLKGITAAYRASETLMSSAKRYRDAGALADADRVDQQRERVGRYISKLQAYALQLQEYDAFMRIRDGFLRPYGRGWTLYALVIAAAVGSLGFILAISTKADTATAASPALATMSKVSGSTASASLWSQLNLEKCAGDGATDADPVPVLIVNKAGAGQYTVETIPRDGCLAREFDVDESFAIVVQPTPSVVTLKSGK